MARKIGILLAVVIVIVSVLCVVQAQTVEKKSKKTVTLPNGEVILDVSGEWDALIENYGSWSQYGSYPQKVKITQEGTSFVGIRMMNDPYNMAGSTIFRGELDKSGFKNVKRMSVGGEADIKGQISDDGSKITFDDGERARATLTRK